MSLIKMITLPIFDLSRLWQHNRITLTMTTIVANPMIPQTAIWNTSLNSNLELAALALVGNTCSFCGSFKVVANIRSSSRLSGDLLLRPKFRTLRWKLLNQFFITQDCSRAVFTIRYPFMF